MNRIDVKSHPKIQASIDRLNEMIEQFKREILESGVYAICSSVENPIERRAFMQEFIATLNRKKYLNNEDVKQWKDEYLTKAERC